MVSFEARWQLPIELPANRKPKTEAKIQVILKHHFRYAISHGNMSRVVTHAEDINEKTPCECSDGETGIESGR